MSSDAAQLPRQRGGTCRHRRAVIGCRAPQTLQPERGLGRPAGATVVVAVEDVRTPATPFVALFAVRTSVHLVARSSSVQATGVHATGVIRVSGQTGVRTDRRPVSAAAASALSGPRCIPDVGAAGQATFGGSGSTCRCSPRAAWSSLPESGLAGKGWSNVGSAWLAQVSTADLGRRFAVAPAAAPRSPTKEAGPAPGCRSVGWGAREGAGASKSPAGASWAGCRRDARPWLDRKVATTLGGRCAGVGLVSSGAGGPGGFSGA
jgi:hypothetical protein